MKVKKENMKICIGIISYFSDDEIKRKIRKCRLKSLLSRIRNLFEDISIIIIAQNWTNIDTTEILDENMIAHRYEKLGILRARKNLREVFLATEFDWMIHFDDDCCLEGSKEDASRYSAMLKHSEPAFINFRGTEFKLSAIHKELYKRNELPEVSPEEGTGYEDFVYFHILKTKEKQIKGYDFGTLKDINVWIKDKNITSWDREKSVKILANSIRYLNKLNIGAFQ